MSDALGVVALSATAMRLRSSPVVSSLPLQRLLHFNAFYSAAYGAAEIALVIYKLVFLSVDEKVKYSLPVLVAVWCLCEPARILLGYTGNLREKVCSPGRYPLLPGAFLALQWLLRRALHSRASDSAFAPLQVSELSAFWLLTLFPQLPLVIYLTIGQHYIGGWMPLDLAVGVILIAMNVRGSARQAFAYNRRASVSLNRCVECALLQRHIASVLLDLRPLRPRPARLLQLAELLSGYGAIRSFIAKQTADFTRLCREDALAALAADDLGGAPLFSGAAAYGETASLLPAGLGGGSGFGGIGTSGSGSAAFAAGDGLGLDGAADASSRPAVDVSVSGIAAAGARHLVSLASGGSVSASSTPAPSAAAGAAAARRVPRPAGGLELPPIATASRPPRDKQS